MKGYYGVYEELFARLDRQEMEAEASETGKDSSREPAPKFGEILPSKGFSITLRVYRGLEEGAANTFS